MRALLVCALGTSLGLAMSQLAWGADTWVRGDCTATDSAACHGPTFETVTEAVAAAGDGDTVWVSPGRYGAPEERFPIAVTKRVVIRSSEEAGSAVVTGSPGRAVFEVTSPGAQIRGLAIEHAQTGIVVMADDVVVADNRVVLTAPTRSTYWTTSCGLWLAGACRVTVLDNQFVGCGISLAGPRVGRPPYGALAMTGLYYLGDQSKWFDSHVIRGNTVNDRPVLYIVGEVGVEVSGDVGQVLIAGCSGVTVHGVTIREASVGIQVAHSSRVRILDSELDQNGLFGAALWYCTDCLLSNLACEANDHAVDMRGGFGNHLLDSTATDNSQAFFVVGENAALIARCYVARNGVGLRLYDALWTTLDGNDVLENSIGFYVEGGTDSHIVANRIASNAQGGVRIARGNKRIVIERNRVQDNGTGVLVLESEAATVRDNEVIGSSLTGIYLFSACATSILANAMSNNGVGVKVLDSRGTAVHQNAFLGMSPGVINFGGDAVDARQNWWSGGRALIEGLVAFEPLLETSPWPQRWGP